MVYRNVLYEEKPMNGRMIVEKTESFYDKMKINV